MPIPQTLEHLPGDKIQIVALSASKKCWNESSCRGKEQVKSFLSRSHLVSWNEIVFQKTSLERKQITLRGRMSPIIDAIPARSFRR